MALHLDAFISPGEWCVFMAAGAFMFFLGCVTAVIYQAIHRAVRILCTVPYAPGRRARVEIESEDMQTPRRPPSVITVNSSPRPALSASPVRRAGKARLTQCRRATKVRYNPRSKYGDCGYQVLLRAAGRSTTRKSVLCLRAQVAQEFHRMYHQQEKVQGIDLAELLQFECKSVESYMNEIKKFQWASQVELTIAAQLLGLGVLLTIGKVHIELTANPKFRVKMKGQHYMLVTMRQVPVARETGWMSRAGMNRSRSRSAPRASQRTVSPTQPYVIPDDEEVVRDQQQDEDHEQDREEVQQPPLRIRSPPPREPRPEPPHPDDPCASTSLVQPTEYPPAQVDPVPRPAVCPNRIQRAWVYAHPNASTWDVMADLAEKHDLRVPPYVQPYGAAQWQEVQTVVLPRAEEFPQLAGTIDMRRFVWEMIEPMRQFAVINEGRVEFLVATSALQDVDTVLWRLQDDVDINADQEIIMQINPVGMWAAYIRDIPRAGSSAAMIPHPLPRAGMQRQREQHDEAGHDQRLVEVVIPAMPARQVAVQMHRTQTVPEMQQSVAERFMAPKHKVRVIALVQDEQAPEVTRPAVPAAEVPPPDEEFKITWRWAHQAIESPSRVLEVKTNSLVVDLQKYLAKTYLKNPEDIIFEYLGTVLSPTKRAAAYANGTLVAHDRLSPSTPSPWQNPSLFRGGAKGNNQHQLSQAQQKQEMQKWAADKLLRHLPFMDVRTAKYIVRAESRMPNAVMNSKSSLQSSHIVAAAFKRMGCHDKAEELVRQVSAMGRQEDVEGTEPQPQLSRQSQHHPPSTQEYGPTQPESSNQEATSTVAEGRCLSHVHGPAAAPGSSDNGGSASILCRFDEHCPMDGGDVFPSYQSVAAGPVSDHNH